MSRAKIKITAIGIILIMLLSVFLTPETAQALTWVDGENYSGTATGFGGDVTVKVTVENGKIKSINPEKNNETLTYWETALDVIDSILKKQSTDVDTISGATRSSGAIIEATKDALSKAEMKVYLNGDTGSDENTGLGADAAVKTIEKAKEILGDKAGTIVITGTVTLSDEKTLNLESLTLKRGDAFTGILISVTGTGNVNLSGLTLDGGTTENAVSGNLIKIAAGGQLALGKNTYLKNNNCSSDGAAISNSGTLVIDGANIINNSTSSNGGAIYNNCGNVTLKSGEITGNTAVNGGAIENDGAPPTSRGTLTITGGSISSNTASGNGGGVYNWFGNMTMSDGSIENNTAITSGGGVYQWIGTLKISGGLISSNKGASGAGVYMGMGAIQVSGSVQIRDNTKNENAKSNINSSSISVTSELASNSYISVESTDTNVTGSNYTLTEDDASKFLCDNGKYVSQLNAKENTISFVEQNVNKEQWEEVYLNGIKGSDDSDGSTPESAVKTFDEAKARLKENGTIYVTGMVSVSNNQTWSLENKGNAKILRDSSYVGQEPGEENDHDYIDGPIVEVIGGGDLTLENIEIDGNGNKVQAMASAVTVKEGNLTIDEGTTISNNVSLQHNGGGVYVYSAGALLMKGGKISENTSAGYGGGLYNGGSFDFRGGEISNNKAGYNGGGIFNNGKMSIQGKLKVTGNKLNETASNLFFAKGKYAEVVGELDKETILKVDSHLKPALILKSTSNYTLSDEDSKLITLDEASNKYKTELEDGNLYISLVASENTKAVYLNGKTGNDSSDGTISAPVKTFEQALTLVQNGGTIYINGEVDIENTQVWDGSGKNVTVKRHYRTSGYMIKILDGGNLTLKNITVSGEWEGSGISSEGAIAKVESGGKLTVGTGAIFSDNNSVESGGAIYNSGNCILRGGTLKGNNTTSGDGGGAVYNSPTGTFRMISGTISGNTAFCGGGIENEGKLIIQGGSITDNETRGGGAGIHNFGENGGSFKMYGGTIKNNVSTENYGGGVFLWQCAATFTGGTIEGNKAESGAGIYAFGQLTMSGTVKIIDGITQLKPLVIAGRLSDNALITLEDTGIVAKGSDEYSITDEDARKIVSLYSNNTYFDEEKDQVRIADTATSLDKSKLTLKVGEKSTLIAEVTPSTASQKVTWSSNQEDVATVVNGVITAKSEGKATITVTNEEGESATCNVIVEKWKQTITAKSHKKAYGDKAFSLNAKCDGDGKISYVTSDSKIATVSNSGKITIKGTGKVKIYITASETDKYEKASKTITLTVSPKKATITSVSSKKAKTLKVKWKKDSKATGYQIVIATNKSFTKGKKIANVKSYKTVSKTFTKLKKGKKYYIKVRAYKTIDGKKVYGSYSKVKTKKIK